MITLEPIRKSHMSRVSEYTSDDCSIKESGILYGHDVELPAITGEGLEHNTMILDHQYSSNYGHWLHDCMPLLLLGLKHGCNISQLSVNHAHFFCQHITQWLNICNVGKTMLYTGEYAQIHYPFAWTSMVDPVGIDLLRNFIQRAVSLYPSVERRILFIQRGILGTGTNTSRNLENRNDLLNELSNIPIELTYIEDLPVFQQIAMFHSAKLIIAVHGTALSNLVFCQPDCKVIEIKSPLFWNATYTEIGAYLGLNYKVINGCERHGNTNLWSHSVYVPTIPLVSMIRDSLQS